MLSVATKYLYITNTTSLTLIEGGQSILVYGIVFGNRGTPAIAGNPVPLYERDGVTQIGAMAAAFYVFQSNPFGISNPIFFENGLSIKPGQVNETFTIFYTNGGF